MLCYLRVNISLHNIERFGVLKISCDIFLSNTFGIAALLCGTVDDFIINISKILHVSNIPALPDKEAADGIENHQRAGIAQMDIVINSGTATVYAYLPRLNGDKLLFARMLGIIEPDRHGILPFIDSNISTSSLKQTAVLLR